MTDSTHVSTIKGATPPDTITIGPDVSVSLGGVDLSYFHSHFLKVSSPPFYSLIGTLSKSPANADSRLFWSGASRDLMFGKIPVAVSETKISLWVRDNSTNVFPLGFLGCSA